MASASDSASEVVSKLDKVADAIKGAKAAAGAASSVGSKSAAKTSSASVSAAATSKPKSPVFEESVVSSPSQSSSNSINVDYSAEKIKSGEIEVMQDDEPTETTSINSSPKAKEKNITQKNDEKTGELTKEEYDDMGKWREKEYNELTDEEKAYLQAIKDDPVLQKLDKISEDNYNYMMSHEQYVQTVIKQKDKANFGIETAAFFAKAPQHIMTYGTNRASRKVSEKLIEYADVRYYANAINVEIYETNGDALKRKIETDFQVVGKFDYAVDYSIPEGLEILEISLTRYPQKGKKEVVFTRDYEKKIKEGYRATANDKCDIDHNYWPYKVFLEFCAKSRKLITFELTDICYISLEERKTEEWPGMQTYTFTGAPCVIKNEYKPRNTEVDYAELPV